MKPFGSAGTTDDIPQPHKSLNCMLGVIVVPRYAVVIQECKEPVPIPLESPLVSGRNIRCALAL